MRIADFRDAVDTLNWNRNDLSGATREEFKRMDVATRLNRYIAEVEKALPYVHPRFTLDLEYARMSIESARVVIEGWKRLER